MPSPRPNACAAKSSEILNAISVRSGNSPLDEGRVSSYDHGKAACGHSRKPASRSHSGYFSTPSHEWNSVQLFLDPTPERNRINCLPNCPRPLPALECHS